MSKFTIIFIGGDVNNPKTSSWQWPLRKLTSELTVNPLLRPPPHFQRRKVNKPPLSIKLSCRYVQVITLLLCCYAYVHTTNRRTQHPAYVVLSLCGMCKPVFGDIPYLYETSVNITFYLLSQDNFFLSIFQEVQSSSSQWPSL